MECGAQQNPPSRPLEIRQHSWYGKSRIKGTWRWDSPIHRRSPLITNPPLLLRFLGRTTPMDNKAVPRAPYRNVLNLTIPTLDVFPTSTQGRLTFPPKFYPLMKAPPCHPQTILRFVRCHRVASSRQNGEG